MFWDSILNKWRSSSSLSCCSEAMRPPAEKARALSLLMALSQALGFVLKATSFRPSYSCGGKRLLKAATSSSSWAAKSLRLLVGDGTGVTSRTCRSGGSSGSCSGVMSRICLSGKTSGKAVWICCSGWISIFRSGKVIWAFCSGWISGFRSGELWVDQSDKGVGLLGWIFGHGPTIISPHLESSVRGSLNLGGEWRRRPR